jgi:hypothetical protein
MKTELVMSKEDQIMPIDNIQSLIFTIRGVQVIQYRDLAKIYGVEAKRLNKQVKRNVNRFPKQFRFQLTETEKQNRSQIATGLKNLNTLRLIRILLPNKVRLCLHRFFAVIPMLK